MAKEGTERMDTLPEKNTLNIHLIQELQQQRNEISRQREERLLNPVSTQYPQGSRYPQDSTAFGRPQRDTQGQRGTRGQGRQTCSKCGGSHCFTEYKCQGLKDLIRQGFVHLSNQRRLVAGTHNQPKPVLPRLGNEGRLKGIKNWLSTH